MNLSDANRRIHKNKKPRRIGRGPGSGHGKTAGRGHKGQGQLAGWSAHPAFEGGQTQLVRRIPKRGFHNQFAPHVFVVNVGEIEELFAAGEEVSLETLRGKGRVKGPIDELKILGHGELTKKLKVSAHRFSNTALEKIRQAGGEAIVVPGRTPVAERKPAANS
ncbi:MAG: 50S ribosomal protein L15 [Pirellulales bacterium]